MIEKDVRQLLKSASIGDDSNIKIGAVPSSPDNVIVITTADSVMTNLENAATSRALIPPGIKDIQQTITITVRNTDYDTGQDKAWDVYRALAGEENGYQVCSTNNRKMFFITVQPPRFSQEDTGKFYFTFNIVLNTSRD
ncbi:MAG: hypothetical protein A2Y25_02035 [Candidatus Melainabacteria bacterium GWF2_37_15]|nr:MAG: hypothetical protein A2Y25_02035 [Candidatus Melainabacteria bacterium GWF2_37_15]